jgi:hypothetical protein
MKVTEVSCMSVGNVKRASKLLVEKKIKRNWWQPEGKELVPGLRRRKYLTTRGLTNSLYFIAAS